MATQPREKRFQSNTATLVSTRHSQQYEQQRKRVTISDERCVCDLKQVRAFPLTNTCVFCPRFIADALTRANKRMALRMLPAQAGGGCVVQGELR